MTIQRFHVGKRLADMVVHNGTIYPDGQTPARATVRAKLAASGYKIEIQVIAAA